MREAADGVDALGKHPVSPGTILPARELLGDLLVDAGRFEEALGAYEASLKLYPGRFAALFGAGHAAELAGKRDIARKRYGELLAVAGSGDGKRAELRQARAALGAR